MKKTLRAIIVAGVLLAGLGHARAETVYIAGTAFHPVPPSQSNCSTLYSEAPFSTGDDCVLVYPIERPAGTVISTITVYYYDDSPPQYMEANLEFAPLDAFGMFSLRGYIDGGLTSSDVQTATLPQSKTITMLSNYGYVLIVTLRDGTMLRGVSINYD